MSDHGFFLTLHAIRRQLAAMPNELYLVRLIHPITGRPCPGERLWPAGLLGSWATVRFLRARNREGFDIYIHPYADGRNSGYILVDLDRGGLPAISTMRDQGHEPCVVLQTSPGRFQAWVRVSAGPLEPALATAIGRQLARLYRADPASTDWRHLGRLAGFTNRKPQRRSGGYAPWVKLLHAQAGLATHSAALIQTATASIDDSATSIPTQASAPVDPPDPSLNTSAAMAIYRQWLHRLRIPQRFSPPDWSVADLWIAKELLRCGVPHAQVHTILQLGSPGFPRRHPDPDDYLRRTLTRAALALAASPFSGRDRLQSLERS